MTYEFNVKTKAFLRQLYSHGLIKDSSCASEIVSVKEDAEELKLPIPISAVSTYNQAFWGTTVNFKNNPA